LTVLESPAPAEFLTPTILKAQQGDRKAFDALCKELRPRVLQLCRRMLRNEEDAEEATQKVLLRALDRLPGFRGDCPVHIWVLAIARRFCLNHLRREAGRGSLSLDEVDERDPALTTPGFEADVIESTYRNQLPSLIRDFCTKAKPKWDDLDLAIFHWFYEEGITSKREVAERVGRSEDTVKYRICHHIAPKLIALEKFSQAGHNGI
jgi:RNA polymerase sigma factor (sigma-70 family)